MSTQNENTNQGSSTDSGCKGCNDKDNATQKSIKAERRKVCNALYDSAAELARQVEKFDEENKLYHQKKCLFVNTEDNYRRFRNLDISVGTELIQTNESVKANVVSFTKWNKELNTTLKNIAKGIKDVKTKFNDLQKAANDLDNCLNDSCNKAQRKALTGRLEDCNSDSKIPDACKEAGTIIDELICKPKGLWTDIDSIFKSSSDVVGIQVFSNVETLEQMQKPLEEHSKAFKSLIEGIVKQREADMKKQQEALVTTVRDITKAAMDRNTARSNFNGNYDAVEMLCCPDCSCAGKLPDNYNDECEKGCTPRLLVCEKKICKICEDVKETFCCDPEKRDNDCGCGNK
ncbi:MAG: hypothetical protein QM737_15385 [Ferruginibacter sp.]